MVAKCKVAMQAPNILPVCWIKKWFVEIFTCLFILKLKEKVHRVFLYIIVTLHNMTTWIALTISVMHKHYMSHRMIIICNDLGLNILTHRIYGVLSTCLSFHFLQHIELSEELICHLSITSIFINFVHFIPCHISHMFNEFENLKVTPQVCHISHIFDQYRLSLLTNNKSIRDLEDLRLLGNWQHGCSQPRNIVYLSLYQALTFKIKVAYYSQVTFLILGEESKSGIPQPFV